MSYAQGFLEDGKHYTLETFCHLVKSLTECNISGLLAM